MPAHQAKQACLCDFLVFPLHMAFTGTGKRANFMPVLVLLKQLEKRGKRNGVIVRFNITASRRD
jgi:hypothetical protein